MLGIVIGSICLFALLRVVRRGHGWRRHAWHGEWAACAPQDPGYDRFRLGRRRGVLRWIFRRLDTTPGQEKLISQEWHGLWDKLGAVRPELRDIRRAVAELMRQDSLDEAALDGLWDRQHGILKSLRETISGSMVRLHAALDARQRTILAQWFESRLHS